MPDFFSNLPEIITALSENSNGLIAIIWLISAIAMQYIFRRANQYIKAIIYLYSLTAVAFLAYMIILENRQIEARQEGWTYYEVDARGEPTRNGRIDSLDSKNRQYQDLRIGGNLRTREAAKLHNSPTPPRNVTSLSSNRACFKILKLGHPFPVEEAESGGWIKVGVVRCPDLN